MAKKRPKKTGFTLIELTVTLGIIAVLMALSTAGFISARKRAAQTKMIADVVKIQGGLEAYYARNRTYPPDLSSLAGDYIDVVPKAPDGGDYPYQANYVFDGTTTNKNDTTFDNRASTLMKNINQTIDPNVVDATGCASLKGTIGTRTYAYRLGTPLYSPAGEAANDATPCTDKFYDVLGPVSG